MSLAGFVAVQALIEDILDLTESLKPDKWHLDSGCHGWRVQDVIAHMAYFFIELLIPKHLAQTVQDCWQSNLVTSQ